MPKYRNFDVIHPCYPGSPESCRLGPGGANMTACSYDHLSLLHPQGQCLIRPCFGDRSTAN